jgi:hypothetical protein
MEFEVRIVFNDLWNFEGDSRLIGEPSPSQQRRGVCETVCEEWEEAGDAM